ncbi:MAG TPA: beta-N-acetylhexosaminidase [Chitinophagaceae bacterium]|nr:beta-N-acetylhexosaminidase [Chitinophagaceae bacterium]
MKYSFLLAAICILYTACQPSQNPPANMTANTTERVPAIIPQPASLTQVPGHYSLPQQPVIVVRGKAEGLDSVLQMLENKLRKATGYPVEVRDRDAGDIELTIYEKPDEKLGREGYHLQVQNNGIRIMANTAAGIFYGIQTMWQLFPAAIESSKPAANMQWNLPMVNITDYPRFAWRGLMFDVARHFFTVADVKQYIDQMVRYKYNLLHLHLTDDQGWRIEIKSLPELTKTGAWNVKKTGKFGSFTAPPADAPRNYGGYYTQEDIKSIVAYAKNRFVDILPEIDVPGHSLAAVASYPELSCTPGTYQVNSGEPFMNWYAGGFSAMVDNTLCPANEKVYDFLDKVFTEVAQLFPFGYIHMGGDECAKNFWEKSAAIKALMQREKLKDMHEVQSYFVKRVEKIIESKGKRMIGWDEILEGGLAPNATVMSWRGIQGGIDAAKMGHEVVMSPTTYAYIDFMQGDPIVEPPVYASLRLSKAYSFDPVPDSVDPKLIKGGQANLWTEQVYNMRHAEYMTWPRGFAIAEDLWSPAKSKNWNDFVRRVESQFAHFDAAGIKYAPSMYEPDFKAYTSNTGQLQVELLPEIEDLDMYYSFDNSYPDNHYPRYDGRLDVPVDATTMRVVCYRHGKQVSRFITMPVAELSKRAAADKK